MSKYIQDLAKEIDENFDDLGVDILLTKSVIIALQHTNGFTPQGIDCALRRMKDCIDQHTTELRNVACYLLEEASPSRRAAEPPAQQSKSAVRTRG